MKITRIVSAILIISIIMPMVMPSALVMAETIDTDTLIVEGPNGPDDIIEVIFSGEMLNADGSITADVSIKASRMIAYDLTFDAIGDPSSSLEALEYITSLPLYPKNTYDIGRLTFPQGGSLVIRQDKWGYSLSDHALMVVVDLASFVLFLIGATPPTHLDINTITDIGADIIGLLPVDAEGTILIMDAVEDLMEDIEAGSSAWVIAGDFVGILSLVPGTAVAISTALVYLGIAVSAAEVGAVLASVEVLLNSTDVLAGIGDLINQPRHVETIIKNLAPVELENLDIALIIDSSGSMTSSDPLNLRKVAANLFVNTMHDMDQVAVIDFDSYTRVPFHIDTVGDNRLLIEAAIRTIDSSGGTNIGAGLLQGYNELLSSTMENRKAAVLITDGMGTYTDEALLYRLQEWPVYTVGLGPYTDEALLEEIATQTGGRYFKLTSASQLTQVYFEIANQVSQGDIINNLDYWLFPNTYWDVYQPVPPDVYSVYFFVNWPGSEVSTTLITPNGNQIDASTIDPNVFHAKGLTYELYRIDNPLPGEWTVRMYGTDLPIDGENVNFQVSVIRETASNQPPVLSPPGNQTIQYSDLLEFQITATDPDNLPDSLAFTAADLPDGIIFTDNGDGTATVSGIATLPPGTYDVEITVTDPDGLSDAGTVSINVTQEDARITYTGPMLVSTPCADCSTATVPLRATIQDITAVLGDPAYDAYPGDITNATVTFINRESNAVLCSAPVTLFDPSYPTTGTAYCEWVADIGANDGYDFNLGILVDGYYTRNSTADDVIVVISKPSTNSVTGGGYLLNQSTAGTYAGDLNLRTHFGFNIKFINNRGRGQDIVGRATLIVRQGGHIYRIRTNALESLIVVPASGDDPAVGEFYSKASIEDVTDPNNPILITSQAFINFTMTDYEEASGQFRDLLGISVWARNGALLFSSNWTGTQTIEQAIEAGNLEIHQFTSQPK